MDFGRHGSDDETSSSCSNNNNNNNKNEDSSSTMDDDDDNDDDNDSSLFDDSSCEASNKGDSDRCRHSRQRHSVKAVVARSESTSKSSTSTLTSMSRAMSMSPTRASIPRRLRQRRRPCTTATATAATAATNTANTTTNTTTTTPSKRRNVLRFVACLCLLLVRNLRLVAAIDVVADAALRSSKDSVTQQQEQQQQPQIGGTNSKDDSSSTLPLPPQPEIFSRDDTTQDSLFDPLQADPDCSSPENNSDDCWAPPASTLDDTASVRDRPVLVDATCSYGGADPDQHLADMEVCQAAAAAASATTTTTTASTAAATTTATAAIRADKHWGSDPNILRMRDQLRQTGSGESIKAVRRRQQAEQASSSNDGTNTTSSTQPSSTTTPTSTPSSSTPSSTTTTSTSKPTTDPGNRSSSSSSSDSATENLRPPIFLMPGLASTRLVAWRYKACAHPLLTDIKVQDIVWLNLQFIMQMGTIDCSCVIECMQLGWNQSDTDDLTKGCKLRPDEGLDAISSLSPAGAASQLLVGGTNTVYAWLIQWLADHLGYDVGNIVGLPNDWRLSPDKMESRDGFLTLTRRRIEAAVQSNGGKPGIMVAHSMGNSIFRYFLEWLRTELRQEAYDRYVKQAARRAKFEQRAAAVEEGIQSSSFLPGWMNAEWWPKWAEENLNKNGNQHHQFDSHEEGTDRNAKLWELAQMEGDDHWYEWIETHIWTYVGLSAPMLGAVNPLRAVISGENMGIPITDHDARVMELTFGSTHTVNPISTKEGFCDQWEVDRWDEEPSPEEAKRHADTRLACLDDILTEIEYSSDSNPWKNFPALERLMRDRVDWDSDHAMIGVTKEYCQEKEKSPCANTTTLKLGPKDAQTGNLFTQLSETWKEEEEPLVVKREQLRESFWDTKVRNILNHTWERPLIKHVIMAYGVDIPTEVGYAYKKREVANDKRDGQFDGVPNLQAVIWEEANGAITEERIGSSRGGLTDLLTKKKPKRIPVRDGRSQHSGDGSVPYLSLSWVHTWLLHAARALRHSGKDAVENPLHRIEISHRPEGAMEWKQGPAPDRVKKFGEKQFEESRDTGTQHPHGTKYKPEMVRYHSNGTSRTTGIEYTTTVLEAIGVEHKETTRNYDILAAVFTDVLKFMHEDLDIV